MKGWQPHPMAEQAISNLTLETDTAGRIWQYLPEPGTYRHTGTEGAIHRFIVEQVGSNNYQHKHGVEVVRIIAAQKQPRILPEETEGKLATLNITLDISNPQKPVPEPHSPQNYLTANIPVEYTSGEWPHKWQTFLDETWAGLHQDDQLANQRLLAQFFGACLANKIPPKGALFLHSDHPNSGKSTILAVLTALLGHQNVAQCSPHKLAEDRWAAAQLFGTLANIVPDIAVRKLDDPSAFKSLTGGNDLITGDIKYKNPIAFYNTAPSLFASNRIPQSFQDQTLGYWSRIIALPCPNSAKNPNQQLLTELVTELPAILNWSLVGLHDLHNNGWNWTIPAHALHHQKTAWEADNLPRVWADQQTEQIRHHHISTKQAGDAYEDWLIIHGHADQDHRLNLFERRKLYQALDDHWGDRVKHSNNAVWKNRRILPLTRTEPTTH